jgi:hypothetical protein
MVYIECLPEDGVFCTRKGLPSARIGSYASSEHKYVPTGLKVKVCTKVSLTEDSETLSVTGKLEMTIG